MLAADVSNISWIVPTNRLLVLAMRGDLQNDCLSSGLFQRFSTGIKYLLVQENVESTGAEHSASRCRMFSFDSVVSSCSAFDYIWLRINFPQAVSSACLDLCMNIAIARNVI